MKLLLFSDLDSIAVKDVETQLIDLTRKNKLIIGYISSCPDPTREFYGKTKDYYARFGAKVTPYLDLETGFNNTYLDLVFQADAIHLSGGNTYQFFHWIIQRGLIQRLQNYARSRVIIGVSAGAIIMTPDISYSKLCGDKNDIGLKNLAGLGLVNFCFVPHAAYKTKVTQEILLKSQQDKSRVVVACDRDWIAIDGLNLNIYGNPQLVIDGKIKNIQNLAQ